MVSYIILFVVVILIFCFFYYVTNGGRNSQNTFSNNSDGEDDYELQFKHLQANTENASNINSKTIDEAIICIPKEFTLPFPNRVNCNVSAKKETSQDIYNRIIESDKKYEDELAKLREHREKTKRRIHRFFIICVSVFAAIAIISTVILGRTIFSHEVLGANTVCYVTDYGECYHSSDCHYLRSSNKTTVYKAKKNGYRSCLRCGVGPLDKSIKNGYGQAALCSFGVGLVLCLSVYFVYAFISNKNENEYFYYQENRCKKLVQGELAILTEAVMRKSAEVPDDIDYIDGMPVSKDDRFIAYISYSGHCYHEYPTCRGVRLRKIHSFYCKRYDRCSYCNPKKETNIPEWHKKYMELVYIKQKYNIT